MSLPVRLASVPYLDETSVGDERWRGGKADLNDAESGEDVFSCALSSLSGKRHVGLRKVKSGQVKVSHEHVDSRYTRW